MGAEGLPKAFWGVMAVLLLGLGGLILWQGYHTYAILVAVLALAAAVNLR